MPRKRRIALGYFPHHIVQRGHKSEECVPYRQGSNHVSRYSPGVSSWIGTEGLPLLLDDYRALFQTPGISSVHVGHNHVHLIVDLGAQAENVGFLMKRLAGRHTRRVNRLERKTGTNWAGSLLHAPPAFATSM
jgi:putative transposase